MKKGSHTDSHLHLARVRAAQGAEYRSIRDELVARGMPLQSARATTSKAWRAMGRDAMKRGSLSSLSENMHAQLASAAADYGVSVPALIDALLVCIVEDELYNAVLGDRLRKRSTTRSAA